MRLYIPPGTVVSVSFNRVTIDFPTPQDADAFQEWMHWLNTEKNRPGGLELVVTPDQKKLSVL